MLFAPSASVNTVGKLKVRVYLDTNPTVKLALYTRKVT